VKHLIVFLWIINPRRAAGWRDFYDRCVDWWAGTRWADSMTWPELVRAVEAWDGWPL